MLIQQKILFNKEECNSIIWNIDEKITNWDRKDRKYQSHSILYSDETKWIFVRLKDFFENETGIKIVNLKETIHFHKFSVGDWFDLHDDTNPEKENQEYVDSIKSNVSWLGFSWEQNKTSHLYFASNYFDFMYEAAESLIQSGHAYVDKQTPDEIRINRGTLTEPGKNSPWRDKSIEEHLMWNFG